MNKNQSNFTFGGVIAIIALVLLGVLFRNSRRLLSVVFWLVAGLFLLGVIVLVIVAIVMSLKNADDDAETKKAAERQAGLGEEEAKILKAARAQLLDQRKLANKLKDTSVRAAAMCVFEPADKIIKELGEQPEHIKSVRQFLNYYLPTNGAILKNYQHMEERGVELGDVTEKVKTHLREIEQAMTKQYVNLFEDDILDLTVEMEAMNIACHRDGLLSDEEISSPSGGDSDITLTV